MCSSSKLLRSAWLQLLRQHPSPTWLLTAVADVASARIPVIQAKATALLNWLLECLPKPALAHHPSVPAGLLTIPNIQQQVAEQLCRYGAEVPYDQIVAAARRRVPGKATCSNVPRLPTRQAAGRAQQIAGLLLLLHCAACTADSSLCRSDCNLHGTGIAAAAAV
jgi:hypothetical protein